MDTLVIKDFDTALDATREKLILNKDINIEFSNKLNIQIKLEGDQWDGNIDYKIAEFVIRLQKYVLDVYNEAGHTKIRYGSNLMNTNIRITISIKHGCSLINIDLGEWAKNMSSSDLTTTIIVIAVICGLSYAISKGVECYYNFKRVKKEIEEKIRLKLDDNKTIREIVTQTFTFADNTQKHMRYLSSKLKDDDIMTINNTVFSSNEAKELFKHEQIEEIQEKSQYYIDGEYSINTIFVEKNQASISFPDKKRTFSTYYLDNDTLERLFKNCATYQENKRPIPMPLQLTATFSGGVFKEGVIIGVGGKREGAMSFAEASLASASKQEDIEIFSGN